MIRPVAADGRIETGGAFTPIHRPRLVERIQSAATQRIVLIIAPAGYGKSVALRQYLDAVREDVVLFNVHEENTTLLGFARGLADALGDVAPDARKSVSNAYEKSRSSKTPGLDMALWMHAHIKTFTGVIAIDDLHLSENDIDICKFVVSLIERTKGRVRWILASRSTLDLPVGSWLAYGETDLTVDEQDLRFSLDEARETANAARVSVRDEELHQILSLTGGWPTALSFAVRSSTRSVDLRNISANTREMVYRYLAEQVYGSLSEDERDLLHFVGYLQEIDLDVLRRAGYEKAKALIERLRDRVAFIYADRPGVYRCHDLFKDFLQHQMELQGDAAVAVLRLKVARALEDAACLAPALEGYAAVRAESDILRLLERHGFALMAQAHGDAVATAMDALSDDVRAINPVVLGMRGLREAEAGRLDRAESLLQRAIQRSTDSVVTADLTIKLATILFNQGRDVVALLEPVLKFDLPDDVYALALSLLTPAYARSGQMDDARDSLISAEQYAKLVESDEVRARLLHRMGITAMELSLPADVTSAYFTKAQAFANENGLFVTSAAALAALARVAQIYEDDMSKYVWYSQQSVTAASKAGDRLSMQSAIIQIIDAEVRRGNVERVTSLEQQLMAAATSDPTRVAYLIPSRAMLAACRGDFREAHRLLAAYVGKSFYSFDRLFNEAMQSVYALAAGKRDEALRLCDSTLSSVDAETVSHLYGKHALEISRLICAVVQALAGRATVASRILQRQPIAQGPVGQAMRDAAFAICQSSRNPLLMADITEPLSTLSAVGYGGVAKVLENATRLCIDEKSHTEAILTQAELDILLALADGQSPKEIAEQRQRSVHTVRAHIQNVIQKLGCSGRNEALSVARKRGLLA